MDRIEVKFASEDVDGKTGEFSGYGAVFGNIDSHGDVIEKGAFKASLREWRKKKAMPQMLIQHGYGLSATIAATRRVIAARDRPVPPPNHTQPIDE